MAMLFRCRFVDVLRLWFRFVLVVGRLGEMEFAYLFGSDCRIHGLHLDHGCHGSGGPFVLLLEIIRLQANRFIPMR